MKIILLFAILLALIGPAAAAAKNLKTSQVPVFNIYELKIKQGKSLFYDEVAKNNITTSLSDEKGTLAMYSIRQNAKANVAYMIEIYADNNAYQMHLNSPQYKSFLLHSPDIIEADGKRKIDVTPIFLGDKHILQDDKTINNFVIVDVKPEFSQAFKDIVLAEMEQSLKVEDGVLAMYAVADKNDSNRWYFYEIYAREAAYQNHRQTSHFQDYLTQTAEMTSYKEAVSINPSLLMNKGGLKFKIP